MARAAALPSPNAAARRAAAAHGAGLQAARMAAVLERAVEGPRRVPRDELHR
jgi:hypothetical protein